MAQQITAYLSDDGQIYRNQDDAQFADYLGSVNARVDAFVASIVASQECLDSAALLKRWEAHRIGGKEGWMQDRWMLDTPIPLPPPPHTPPWVEAAAPVAAPAKKAKAVKAPRTPRVATAIAQALDAAKAAAEPAKYRKHVAIVGLFNIHHANIAKEFEEALKLTIYDSDCIAKLHGLKGCHKVVVLTKFVSHKHIETLKSIGQEPLLIHGGLDKLKDALTNIYVNS